MSILPIRLLTLDRLEVEDRIECNCEVRDAVFEAEVWRMDQNPMHDEPRYQQLCECCAISLLLESVPVQHVTFEKRGEKVLVGSLQSSGPNQNEFV